MVLIFPLPQCQPLTYRFVHSRIVHPCHIVPIFPLPHFPPPPFWPCRFVHSRKFHQPITTTTMSLDKLYTAQRENIPQHQILNISSICCTCSQYAYSHKPIPRWISTQCEWYYVKINVLLPARRYSNVCLCLSVCLSVPLRVCRCFCMEASFGSTYRTLCYKEKNSGIRKIRILPRGTSSQIVELEEFRHGTSNVEIVVS